jgi:hypothetical protein
LLFMATDDTTPWAGKKNPLPIVVDRNYGPHGPHGVTSNRFYTHFSLLKTIGGPQALGNARLKSVPGSRPGALFSAKIRV